MSKTLGQINETVFDEEWGRPRDGETTKERSLRCFQAAAEAVALECGRRTGKQWDAERAVIEAARAWLRSADPRNPENHIHARHALATAVEALDSEEK